MNRKKKLLIQTNNVNALPLLKLSHTKRFTADIIMATLTSQAKFIFFDEKSYTSLNYLIKLDP